MQSSAHTTATTGSRTTILDQILDWKQVEVAQHKRERPLDVVQAEARTAPPPRDLAAALRAPGVSLIAEIKRASPSRGLLHPNLDPAGQAATYQVHGAAAISVLTDERFFRGTLDDLCAVRRAVRLPVLRKEFVIDVYQVYQARAAGADAVLLIVAALDDARLHALYALIEELGMSALVEVHDEAELARALALAPRILGINNRNLHTFEVSLDVTAHLSALVPPETLLVAESGIHTAADVARLAELDVHGMLVGESLIRAPDVGAKVRELTARTSR
jgi:indole-3-glycerol phosphate synthase